LSLKPHPQPFYADKNPEEETAEKGPSLPSLKNLTKLRELEVMGLPLADVVEAVKENANLRTLVYHGDLLKDCTSEEIGRLAELKQLRVLSIGPHLRWSEGSTLRDEFVPFQNHPNLQVLFLGGSEIHRKSLKQIRGVLPNCVVLSLLNSNLFRVPLIMFSGYLLFMVVMFWISLTQMHNDLFFRYLGAAMLPRYAAPHLLFSGLLLFFWVALNALLLWGSGIPLLAALSILLTPVGFFSLASCRAINPTPSPKSQRKQVAIGAVIFIVVFTFASGGVTGSWLTASTPRFLMETIWIEWIRFVYGFHPLVCLVSLAAAGYLMFTVIQRAPTMYRRLLEAGVVNPGPINTQQVHMTFEWIGPMREGKLPWLWRPLGDEIDQARDRSVAYDRHSVMSLYNRTSDVPRRIWWIMLTVPAIGSAVLMPFLPEASRSDNPIVICVGILAAMAVYTPMFLVGHWYTKGGRFAQEILVRPVTRTDIRRSILGAMFRDTAIWVASVGVILGAVICRMIYDGEPVPLSPPDLLWMVPLWGGVVLIYVAYLQYTVTIRHGWMGGFLLGISGFGVVAAIIGAMLWQAWWFDRKVDAISYHSVSGVVLVFAVWIFSRAYRHLLRAEFA
ncbi:MAG: hypothetical protein KDA36_04880, partial [Planctomycetaceae bacterium]|nr:hypothetical protein [Planctomycetaceae bacterium]